MQIDRFVCFVIFFVVNYDSYISLQSVYKPSFEIAVVLPLFEEVPNKNGVFTKCSRKPYFGTLQTKEAFHYALDLVEKDKELSQNFTLKIRVIENCGSLFEDTMNLEKLLTELVSETETTVKLKTESSNFENDTTSHLIGVIYSNERTELPYDEIFSQLVGFPIISFLGPSKEFFNTYQLGENVIWVSSGHIFVVQLIFRIVASLNWGRLLFIASDKLDLDKVDSFWTSQNVNNLAAHAGVSISQTLSMEVIKDTEQRNNFKPDHPEEYLRKLIPSYDTIDAIVCYCDRQEIQLLKRTLQMARGKNARKLKVIAANAGADEDWKNLEWQSELGKFFYFTPKLQYDKEFHAYYTSLSHVECPENEDLCQNMHRAFIYRNNSQPSNIIKSVHLMAHAVNNLLREPWISSKSEISLEQFREYLKQQFTDASFKLFDEEVRFDEKGFPKEERFEVYKVEGAEKETSHEAIKVAEYEQKSRSYDANTPHPPDHTENDNILDDQCCSRCVSCDDVEIPNEDSTPCDKCPPGYESNKDGQFCIPEPSKWHYSMIIVSVILSSLCVVCALIMPTIVVEYRNTSAAESTTKQLCYVILAGIFLANIATQMSILNENVKTSLGKVLPAIGLTMVYSALLMIIYRMTRPKIISKSKNASLNVNPKKSSIPTEMILIIVLVGLETLICWHSVQINETKLSTEKNPADLILIEHFLDDSFLMRIFGLVVALILLCAYFSIKMQYSIEMGYTSMQENYNENVIVIAFAMYVTIITLVFDCFLYMTPSDKILAVDMFISIKSLVVLVILLNL